MRAIWKESWNHAIIRHVNKREKEKTAHMFAAGIITQKGEWQTIANHSSFCFEVFEPHPLYRLNVLEGCIEFVTQHCQVIVEFLARYLRIDLCRDDVRVSQYSAYTLDGHSF